MPESIHIAALSRTRSLSFLFRLYMRGKGLIRITEHFQDRHPQPFNLADRASDVTGGSVCAEVATLMERGILRLFDSAVGFYQPGFALLTRAQPQLAPTG
jgi:hypothetical protein